MWKLVRPAGDTVSQAVVALTGRRALLAADVAAKALLFALLAHAARNPELPQFADKAMQARVLTYPIAVLAIPVGWRLAGRGRPFPVLADLLITLPFLIDTAGNTLDLHDRIDWWDDANHFWNWALLAGAFMALDWPAGVDVRVRALLAVGFGAVAAITWELLEYVTFIPGSPEAAGAYRDTLGDLALGVLGAALGAGVSAWLLERRGRRSPA